MLLKLEAPNWLKSSSTPAAARSATVNRSSMYTSGPVPLRTAVVSLAMSVSEPGTCTIFTQPTLLCELYASTMRFRLSESGGVCEVQNVTRLVPDLQPARGGPAWLLVPVLQAVITRIPSIRALMLDRGSNVMGLSSVTETCTPRLLPGSDETGARARRREAAKYSKGKFSRLATRCQLGRGM